MAAIQSASFISAWGADGREESAENEKSVEASAENEAATEARTWGTGAEVDVGGRKVKGAYKTYEIEKDSPIILVLSDGSRLKIRSLIDEIFMAYDEEAAPGVPLIMVRAAPIIIYEAPPKARKP